jgi:hypothetical protein
MNVEEVLSMTWMFPDHPKTVDDSRLSRQLFLFFCP